MTILLLAGTSEARRLSHLIAATPPLITSLAGVTDSPADHGGTLRRGGFGGPDGLARYITDNNVRLIIDATHPFAARMTSNAATAAAQTGCRLLHLRRSPWPVEQAWTRAADLGHAADLLVANSIAFLATGRGSIPHFLHRKDVRFIVRVIDDKPADFPLAQGQFLISRPPFSVAQEVQTLKAHKIDTLVTRNSGGQGGAEKIRAAEQLGLRIIMVDRPPAPAGETVETVEAALKWLEAGAWLAA